MEDLIRFQAESAGLLTTGVDQTSDRGESPAPDRISVPALIFYSGTHNNGGQKLKFSKQRTQKMADLTNQRLQSRRTKVYLDHGGGDGMFYDQRTSIGALDGPVTTRTIEKPSDIPFPNLFDKLQGELGIYATIVFTGEENVKAYQSGNFKEISIGHDSTGTFSDGLKGAIHEVSVVGIQVLPGAALFSAKPDPLLTDLQAALFGLTLGENMSRRAIDEDIHKVFWTFTETLENIMRADDEDLGDRNKKDLKRQAVSDLASAIASLLNLNAPAPEREPLPTVPTFQQEPKTMPEEETNLQDPTKTEGTETYSAEQFRAMESRMLLMEQRENIANTYGSLRHRARTLLDAGKVTPAFFKETFSAQDVDGIVQLFAAEAEDKPAAAIAQLTKVEAQIEYAEKYGVSAKDQALQLSNFGSLLQSEPLPTVPGKDPQAEQSEHEVDGYLERRGYSIVSKN
jgi:hypothetical protein